MKLLVGIPVVTGADHCKAAIDSVIEYADVLLISNGADEDVTAMIGRYEITKGNNLIDILTNENNIYVNPAWNQILDYFFEHKEYTHLIIMNSDLTMFYNWHSNLIERWAKNTHDIYIPRINADIANLRADEEVQSGTPGVFITLTRAQARLIYPIPDGVRIWFGDQYIYTILRRLGFKTIVCGDLHATTEWSKTIQRVPEAQEIIEVDKKWWDENGEQSINERI